MTGDREPARPRIRHNDYSPLTPPDLGAWTPTLTVSVVIPARSQRLLDLTLAALSAQTYPAHLTEVIVVDDGAEPPLRLPEIAPENTRIVRSGPDGWGIAHAINTGAAQAEGEILQRLDSDMVICAEHLEALLRWHHLTDYVVTIGGKHFIEDVGEVTPEQVRDAVARDALGELFDLSKAIPSSTEETIRRLDGLKAAKNPYHNCTGPTLSLRRSLFARVGGLDAAVLRGSDTEFAYRLAMAGVVFVPDLAARAVHLGLPAQRVNRERTVRSAEAYLAHRIPLRRDLRKERGRSWLVPYVEVVYEVGEHTEPQVRAAVNAALDGSLPDVTVTLVAPWSKLPTGRHAVLDDPDFELRLLRAHFADDARVRLADEPAETPWPTPYRYTGPVDVPLGRDTLERMIKVMTADRPLGVLIAELPDGRTARLERTDAVNRARLLAAPGEDLDAVIDATHGVRRAPMAEFWPPKPAPAAAAKPSAAAAQPKAPAKPAAPKAADRPAEGAAGDAAPRRRSLLTRLRGTLRDRLP
ncbi:MAG: glycosyltransferase family A protein [Actinomycetes bacterium]|jgi:GT2 family glycosyltransferase